MTEKYGMVCGEICHAWPVNCSISDRVWPRPVLAPFFVETGNERYLRIQPVCWEMKVMDLHRKKIERGQGTER